MKHTRLSKKRLEDDKEGRPPGRLRSNVDAPKKASKSKAIEAPVPESARGRKSAEHVELQPRDAATLDSLLKLFVITPDEPLTQQIVDRICELVSLGVLKPGDRLPPLKKLADHLHTQTFSINVAYQKLQELNVTMSIDKSGSFVQVQPEAPQLVASMKISEAVHQCRQLGLTKHGIAALFQNQLERHFERSHGEESTPRTKPRKG